MSVYDEDTEVEQLIKAITGDAEGLIKPPAEKVEIKQPVVSPSRKRFSVEITNIGPDLEDRKANDFSLGQSEITQYDHLREAAAKYWSMSDSDTAVYVSPGKNANAEAKVTYGFGFVTKSKDDLPIPIAGSSNPFFEINQMFYLIGDPNAFKKIIEAPAGGKPAIQNDYDKWNAFIEGGEYEEQTFPRLIEQNVEYNYLAYSSPLPYSHEELNKINLTGCQYVKITPEYNFYIKGYENAHRFGVLQNSPETLLPNLYAIALQKNNESSNDHLDALISLDGSLKDEAVPEFRNINDNYGQYFDVWTRQVQKIADIPPAGAGLDVLRENVASKFKNIVVPYNTMSSLKEYSKYKEMFPMYVDVEFKTDRSTEFAQALVDTKLIDEFVWSVVRLQDVPSTTMTFVEFDETISAEMQEDGTILNKKISQSRTKNKKVWNIENSFLEMSTLATSATASTSEAIAMSNDAAFPKTVFLDDGSLRSKLKTDSSGNFFKNLLNVIFVNKLKTFINSKLITYDQMIDGTPCYAEDVVYRIEKSVADEAGNPTNNIVQNFWLPNSNEVDVVNFIDTQVKYGKRYAYRFYAYRLTINTKYFYTTVAASTESGGNWSEDFYVNPDLGYPSPLQAWLRVVQTPELFLIEEEIFATDQLILDDPPIPPEVDIIPYFADGNRLLINLKSAVGEYHMHPIVVSMEDIGWHDDVKISQKTVPGEKVRFKGDDQIAAFEVFRIENRPQSWEEFDASVIATVSNPSASTGELVDYISSNRKYYYMFRAIDVHGHLSNPTEIYEVELVNDEGSIYLNKRIVDLAPREPKNPSKPMRRLLEIKPAIEQTFIDTIGDMDQSAFDYKNLKLGTLQESPWGRKFKFRIVSKKTGKKMDINVDFKAELDTQK